MLHFWMQAIAQVQLYCSFNLPNPNGKALLHTGDFRFCEEMANIITLQMCPIHTLILDTTYCNPQNDFPKQEAVIQFVIEAIQAENSFSHWKLHNRRKGKVVLRGCLCSSKKSPC